MREFILLIWEVLFAKDEVLDPQYQEDLTAWSDYTPQKNVK